MRPFAGELVAGKYRFLRKLGENSISEVWAALNEATLREVAIKLMVEARPDARRRLLREARVSGVLKHPNIVDIYDVVQTEEGSPFLVMELLSGEALAELLADKRQLDPMAAVRIGRDIAKALVAMHAQQIIHRDLNPKNIYLHRPGSNEVIVKVMNFGCARHIGLPNSVRPGAEPVGLPLYMSPEQARDDLDIDHRTDIWSLGVVLFEMLTGVLPFKADNVVVQALSGEIPTVAKWAPTMDARLVEVVDRCLQRDREARFGTADDVLMQLMRFQPMQKGPVSTPKPTTVTEKRHWQES